MSTLNEDGRVMALDLGEKRIGVALSDPLRMIATPLEVVKRSSRKADYARYMELIAEHDVRAVVVGLPTYLNGDESEMTEWVRHYSAEFEQLLNIPLHLHDENMSTERARSRMNELGWNRRKREQLRDAVAAAVFLQDFLDLNAPIYDSPLEEHS